MLATKPSGMRAQKTLEKSHDFGRLSALLAKKRRESGGVFAQWRTQELILGEPS